MTDAAAVETTSTREPILVIADILKRELNLENGQIMLAYENYKIPETPGLYIALDYVSSRKIGGGSQLTPSEQGMLETKAVTMNHVIQIDMMSFDGEARRRKEEVLMALTSLYAERLMDQYGMQIAKNPTDFSNTASLEETKMLNRFSISLSVTALHVKLQPTSEYFDKFHTEFQTEESTVPVNADPTDPTGGLNT